MPDPKHLLYNLKWRLATLEHELGNMTYLLQQIKEEISKMESKQ